MNIFVLDLNPKLAAQYHCDKHVVKMILETAQLLSTAHHTLDSPKIFVDQLYRKTHINHPCAKWVRESKQNYLWTYNLFLELCKEYTHRYHKIHKTEQKLKKLLAAKPNVPSNDLTDFAQAMPDQYKHKSPVIAYRSYYLGEKKNILQYTNRNFPSWLET